MLTKTRGIILRSVKFKESSLILLIFTRELGLKSFIISGMRNQRSGTGPATLQVMNIVDLVAYDKDGSEINRIKEVRPALRYNQLFLNIMFSSIGVFMIEIIRLCIREKEQNVSMYEFLENAFLLLDSQKENAPTFHLSFLLHFCTHLGFQPTVNYAPDRNYFDMIEGRFVSAPPFHRDYMNPQLSLVFNQLAITNLSDFRSVAVPKHLRNELIDSIIKYYKIHLGDFGTVKSLEIFKDIFRA
jgi:DNA repair protein RecO (recombination protein O)